MARMSPPNGPAPCTPESKEAFLYRNLDEALSSDYTVMHSVRADFPDYKGRLVRREADFLVYHPDKGVIVIEQKAGEIGYDGHQWHYYSGQKLKNGAPPPASGRLHVRPQKPGGAARLR